jgi:oxygen tolerance protein BatD
MKPPARATRAALAVLAGLLVLLRSLVAHAAPPSFQMQADADTVGVGDVVHLIVTMQSGDGPPTDPELGATPGFTVRGKNASPSQTHISINGNRTDRWGLTIDYALQAQRVGVFSVGPPNAVVGGVRYEGRSATLHVVPAGQAPPRPPPQQQQPFGFSPFDPWKGLIQQFDLPDQQPSAPSVTTDPRLALDAPRGTLYFLHCTVDKTSAAVGEQIVYSVYEYLDVSEHASIEVDDSDVHDATAAEFVKHPLLREDQEALLAGYAAVGGHTWQVKLVRRWALFPLHAGDLAIGPMSVSVVRPRGAVGIRTTEALTIHVAEPPRATRPPGYALGDVGHFSLSAQVTPRDVDQGGAVGVHVELSGTGNIPSSIATPAREGVEWLAPEIHEQLGPSGHDSFGGKRSFDYVVRVLRSGDVDLGDLSLPFWDADAKRYDVARVSLGVVHAKASAAAPAAASAEPQKLDGLPGARDALEGERPHRVHLDDAPVFWIAGVGSWPLAFIAAVGGRALGRRARAAWHARRTSPAADLRDRVAAAAAACGGSDARAADAAISRALQAATVAHRGVSVLGALGDEVATRLERAGVAEAAASRLAELLRECEAARFSPGDADLAASRGRWTRAQGAIRDLEGRG